MKLLFDVLAREVFPFLITTPERARLWLELIVSREGAMIYREARRPA